MRGGLGAVRRGRRAGQARRLNLRLDLAYDGAPFRGFQSQPGVRTIQGDIEAALARLFGRSVATACAGRTDAGVHALGQVVGVPDALDGIDLGKLRTALNGMCGPSIAVALCRQMPEGWHARFSARSRTYVYAVLEGDIPDPFLARTTLHHPGRLDLDAMNEAAGHLAGEHDFASFGRVPEPGGTSVRTLYELGCGRAGTGG